MSQAQGSEWVKETRRRLDTVASQLDSSSNLQHPTEAAWTRVATQARTSLHRGESARDYVETARAGAETAELLYRSSDEGLTSTGFNPWRHTTFVCGRPVQVPFACICVALLRWHRFSIPPEKKLCLMSLENPSSLSLVMIPLFYLCFVSSCVLCQVLVVTHELSHLATAAESTFA